MLLNVDRLTEWRVSIERAVGGIEFIGFSKQSPHILLCISSQKTTVMDCENSSIKVCDADYDETDMIAFCDTLPNEEIAIASQYGGKLPDSTTQGDTVIVSSKHSGRLVKFKVEFITKTQEKVVIHKDYGYYTCGFSYDGNYFAFAADEGICVLKRV